MHNSEFRLISVFLLFSILVLSLLFLFFYSWEGNSFWELNLENCRYILLDTLPLLQEEVRANNPYEPLGFFFQIWRWVWESSFLPGNPKDEMLVNLNSLSSPRAVPREVATVSSRLEIDPHLYREPDITEKMDVAIFHTHTSETYHDDVRPVDSTFHVLPPGENRGQVVEVGAFLAQALEEKGINVIHDRDIYDQVYSMSYIRAREGLKELLNEHKNLNLILDIHRDGLTNLGMDVVQTDVNGNPAARVMFVISKEAGQENLRVARELAEIMERKYPGLFRRFELREGRIFNQDLNPGLILVEIGGVRNSLSEALYTAELLSEVIYEYLRQKRGGY